jgi:hypothetical protein
MFELPAPAAPAVLVMRRVTTIAKRHRVRVQAGYLQQRAGPPGEAPATLIRAPPVRRGREPPTRDAGRRDRRVLDRQIDEILERSRREHPSGTRTLPDVTESQAVARHGEELAARTRRAYPRWFADAPAPPDRLQKIRNR